MTVNGWFQILLFLVLIFAVTKPLGIFMARIFNRERTFLDPIARPLVTATLRVARRRSAAKPVRNSPTGELRSRE